MKALVRNWHHLTLFYICRINYPNITLQLVIALIAAVKAESNPGFVYTVGANPAVYATPYTYTPYTPLVYNTIAPVAPVVYTAGNTCKNEAGALVPCANPAAGVVPNTVYAYNNAPFGYVQPAVASPVAAAETPAAEEGVVSVEKREAEADAEAESLFYGYYGYPGFAAYRPYYSAYSYYGLPYTYGAGYYASPYFYGAGCRNAYGALVPCAK